MELVYAILIRWNTLPRQDTLLVIYIYNLEVITYKKVHKNIYL